jgi:deoxyadenosine/deoxycytidine kinase
MIKGGFQVGKIVWVEGIVGMGKSTLAGHLADASEWKFLQEPVDENEYLQDFYEDTKRWAFSMQMELLYRRFDQHLKAQRGSGVYVFDRGITGDKVFADMLNADGLITDREYNTYVNSHNIMLKILRKPDLIIYLDGEPEWAYERVRKRNRNQETTLELSYLQTMNKFYDKTFLSNRKDNFIEGVPMQKYIWKDGRDTSYLGILARAMDVIDKVGLIV